MKREGCGVTRRSSEEYCVVLIFSSLLTLSIVVTVSGNLCGKALEDFLISCCKLKQQPTKGMENLELRCQGRNDFPMPTDITHPLYHQKHTI